MNFKLECNHTCFCARVRAGFLAYDYEICTLTKMNHFGMPATYACVEQGDDDDGEAYE